MIIVQQNNKQCSWTVYSQLWRFLCQECKINKLHFPIHADEVLYGGAPHGMIPQGARFSAAAAEAPLAREAFVR